MNKSQLNRREFLRLTGLSAAGFALAACQPAATQVPADDEESPPELDAADDGKAEVPEDEPEEEPAEDAPADEPITVRFWDFPFYSDEFGEPGTWQRERADAFMAVSPNVTVDVLPLTWEQIEKVTTSIAAGSPPELVGGGWIQLAVQSKGLGLAFELTDVLEPQLADDMIDGMLDQCSIEGKVYMVPYWPVCQSGVVYMDVVEEAGATDLAPQPPCYGWNIDEINAWLDKMRGTRPDGSERYGLGIPSAASTPAYHWNTLLYFRSFGLWFWTDELETCVDFATPEAINCLEWMQFLAENDLIPDPAGYTMDDNSALIAQGNIAMQTGNVIPGQARGEGLELDTETLLVNDTVDERVWRYIQYPHDEPHPAICWGGANYSGLVPFKPKESAVASGVVDFIHWMTNEDSEEWLVKSAGMLPFRKSVLEDVADDPLIKYTADCLMPNAWFDAKINTETHLLRAIFEEHFQDAWGGKSAEQVLTEMTEDINSALESCA